MLGPLVIAGVAVKKSKLRALHKLGVKDSKALSAKSRERLYREIIAMADDYHIVRIPPRSVDASVKRHALNHLEAKYMAKIASRLDSGAYYVDSCDVNPRRFGQEISELAGKDKIRSHHCADSRFVIVSAASILAKVSRDRSIARLRQSYDLGSGYPSDPKTIQFVTKFYRTNYMLPSFVRKSWKPTKRILAQNSL